MQKRISETLWLVTGILLFLISYTFDAPVDALFKNIKFPVLDAVLSVITNFGVVIIVSVLIPFIIFYKKNKKLVYFIFLTFMASFALAFLIKLIVLRQRPIEEFTFPFFHIIDYSFPSMHTMIAFSSLPILMKYLPKQKYFFAVFAFLVGFSRIYFRFHFLSDVVFGTLAGYLLGNFLLNLYEKRKNKQF